MKISERTKMELLAGLIFCLTLIWFAQSVENSWNEKRLEELKIEKQKLEIERDEMLELFKNEIKTNIKTKRDSVRDSIPDAYHSGAELNRIEREDDVSAVIENQIREISKENNFKWENYLIRLAKCESSLNPNAKNVNKSGSVDRGVFQINDYWHKEVSDEQAYNLKYATEWTIKRINAGFQSEWVCDAKI